jgi:hypothetical protein
MDEGRSVAPARRVGGFPAIWAPKMRMCIEYFSNATRPGAKVDCVTSTTHVPCNWAIEDVELSNMGGNPAVDRYLNASWES